MTENMIDYNQQLRAATPEQLREVVALLCREAASELFWFRLRDFNERIRAILSSQVTESEQADDTEIPVNSTWQETETGRVLVVDQASGIRVWAHGLVDGSRLEVTKTRDQWIAECVRLGGGADDVTDDGEASTPIPPALLAQWREMLERDRREHPMGQHGRSVVVGVEQLAELIRGYRPFRASSDFCCCSVFGHAPHRRYIGSCRGVDDDMDLPTDSAQQATPELKNPVEFPQSAKTAQQATEAPADDGSNMPIGEPLCGTCRRPYHRGACPTDSGIICALADKCSSCGDIRVAHSEPRCSGECTVFVEADGIIRAAEGKVLEPGEYEIVEIHANDDAPHLKIGDKFSGSHAMYGNGRWVVASFDGRNTWVTAVRRIDPKPKEATCLGCGKPFTSPDHDQRCSSCVESGTGPEPVKPKEASELAIDNQRSPPLIGGTYEHKIGRGRRVVSGVYVQYVGGGEETLDLFIQKFNPAPVSEAELVGDSTMPTEEMGQTAERAIVAGSTVRVTGTPGSVYFGWAGTVTAIEEQWPATPYKVDFNGGRYTRNYAASDLQVVSDPPATEGAGPAPHADGSVLHQLWGLARDAPGYNKEEWKTLQRELRATDGSELRRKLVNAIEERDTALREVAELKHYAGTLEREQEVLQRQVAHEKEHRAKLATDLNALIDGKPVELHLASVVRRKWLEEVDSVKRDLATRDAELAEHKQANENLMAANQSLAAKIRTLEAQPLQPSERIAYDAVVRRLGNRDAELSQARETIARLGGELHAETRACTQLHCDVSNALSEYGHGIDRSISHLLETLRRLSQSNPHAKPTDPEPAPSVGGGT